MPKQTIQSATTAQVNDLALPAHLIKAPVLTLSASNLTTAEVVTLESFTGVNNVFAPIRDVNGTVLTLSGSAPIKQFYNPGVPCIVDKPVTATACGVSVSWPSVPAKG